MSSYTLVTVATVSGTIHGHMASPCRKVSIMAFARSTAAPIDIVARSAPAVGVAVDFVDLDLNTVKEVVVECEVATVNHLVLVELDTVAMVAISTSV